MARYSLTLQQKENLEPYLILIFDKPKDIEFEDGQYGVFLHVNKPVEGRKIRAFSFASSIKDDNLVIATKIPNQPSSFKEHLLALQPGDQMTVDGPMGNMTLNPNKARVFLAGGIGITPIRALLRGLDSYEETSLIYSEQNEIYPFLEEFEEMDGLRLELTSGTGRTKFLIEQQANLNENKAIYYISGSPSFVNGVMAQLKDLGISDSNIKYDRFVGY
jgi:ferredoxin-NADP reductase